MRHLLLALGLVLSTSAFAASAPARGTNGNYRRAEALKAVGAKAQRANVRAANNAVGFIKGATLPKNARILMVQHPVKGYGMKVDLVKAPNDRSQKVEKLSAAQMKRMGLITQAEAQKRAERNGGVLGTKGAVKLTPTGYSERGSYEFAQARPASVTVKQWNNTYAVSSIRRTVTLTGTAESASGQYKLIAEGKPTK
jgi:hypothetical protein